MKFRPRFSLRTFLVFVMLVGGSIVPLRYWWLNRRVETVVFLQWMSVKAIASNLNLMATIDDETYCLKTDARVNAVMVTCRFQDRETIIARIQEMDVLPARRPSLDQAMSTRKKVAPENAAN